MSEPPVEGTLALDAMGGDRGPDEAMAAVSLVLPRLKTGESLVLVGHRDVLEPLAQEHGIGENGRVRLLHAPEVITMEDKPAVALKKKRDSSMMRALELVRDNHVRAALSCGNTGALMAGGTLRLRTMPGVERPALAAVLPRNGQHFVLLDVGANPAPRPEHLVHNAILGSHYCQVVLRKERPRVGLLTIGTEEGKGNELINETHKRLRQCGDLLDYAGLIEGYHVFDTDQSIDVIVTDGFTGNILLKTCESLAGMFKDSLREHLSKTLLRKAGAFLARDAFNDLRRSTNKDRYNGAPLLGLKGNVLKGHGSSNRHAIASAVDIGLQIISHHMYDRALEDIAEANHRMGKAGLLHKLFHRGAHHRKEEEGEASRSVEGQT